MTIKSAYDNAVNSIRRTLNRNQNPVVLGKDTTAQPPVQFEEAPQSGMVWARRLVNGVDRPPFLIRGSTIPGSNQPNIPVEVGLDKQKYQRIVDIDFAGAQAAGVNPTQYAAADPNTNNPAFVNQQFLTTAFPQIVEDTLQIAVRGWLVLDPNTLLWKKFEKRSDNLTVPSAGQHCAAVVAVLRDYSDIEIQYSTAKSTQIELDTDDLNEAWALMSDRRNTPIGSFDIGDGITVLTDKNRWLDIRQLWDLIVAASLTLSDGSTTVPDVTEIDFSGATLTDMGDGVVLVTISGSGTFYQTIQGNGTPATQQPILDFIDGTNTTATVTNDGAGTRTKVKIDVTGITSGINQLTGDVTAGPGSGSQAATLATVNSNVGTFSRVKSVTANAKGLITAITQGLVDLASEVTGLLGLSHGGTGADLSATGPGVLVQASSGANVTVPVALSQAFLADAFKPLVRYIVTTNISVTSAPATIGGSAFNSGDRACLVAQSTGSENGLWVSNGAGNPMSRPTDYASGSTIQAYTNIVAWSVTNRLVYWLTTTGTITIDTTATSWSALKIDGSVIGGGFVADNVGGTGTNSATVGAGSVAIFNNPAWTGVAPGSSGNVLHSNGSAWSSAALVAADIPNLPGSIITSGTVAAARLGTMTGDSGSGGASGAVPAPATGDATGVLTGASTFTKNYLRHLFPPDFTDVNSSSNTENDVFTHTIAAGQLATNGDKINFKTTLFQNSASGTKTIRLYFGGNNYQTLSVSATLGVGAVITAEVTVIRVSSSSVRIRGFMQANSSAAASTTYTPFLADITGLTLSNTQVIKVTSQSSVNNSNNVVGKTCEIEYMAAA